MKTSFSDLFPSPKFLEMPVSGMSIDDSSIFFVQLGREKGKNVLKKYDSQDLPLGILKGGGIINPKELINILSDFKRKNNLSFLSVSLPEEKAFLFRTNIPPMPKEEIREALKFKIEENVPLSSDESLFDFYVVPNKDKNSSGNEVIVSVFPLAVINEFLDVFLKSGLSPVVFKIRSQSIAESVIKNGDNRPFLIVDLSNGRINLCVVNKRLVQFTSNILIEKDFFSSLTFASDKSAEGVVKEEGANVFKLSSDKEKFLKEEIDKLLSYWKSFSSFRSDLGVEKIITCGEGVLDPNFKNYFSHYFSVAAEPADVWVNLISFTDYIPDLDFKNSLKYAPAIGAALSADSHLSKI